jgi:hypothetical protein
MITNVPDASTMEQTALRLYFSAWDEVVKVVEDLFEWPPSYLHESAGRASSAEHATVVRKSQAEVVQLVADAQSDLQLAYTLIQQSQEIGLKAKICAVHPFLLLLGSDVRSWARRNADFSEFRTLDASDLVRVVNAVCPQPLTERFATKYEAVRGNRNKIYHLGIYNDQIDPMALLDLLVLQHRELYPDHIWLQD